MSKRLVQFSIILAITIGGAWAQEAPATREKPLRIGYMSSLFMGFTPQDAKAATKVWGDRMLTRQGTTSYIVQVLIYDDMPSLIQAIDTGGVDVFTVSSREYLEWKDKINAEPWAHTGLTDRNATAYVVIVRKESGYRSLADLRGKSLVIAPNDKNLIPETWLNVSLLKAGLTEIETFFGGVREVNKPERAVLPVFFKQADACVVRKDVFKLITELNPQLEQRLKILAESASYLAGVFCVRKSFDPQDRKYLTNNLLTLSDTIEGRQILNLFRADQAVLFESERMVSVEKLFAEYRQLSGHPAQPLSLK
jgi:phosphonate transport system substrate-binding protein